MTPEEIYAHYKSLLSDMPYLPGRGEGRLNAEALRWLGRFIAVLNEEGQHFDAMAIAGVEGDFGSVLAERAKAKVEATLHRALARFEVRHPAGASAAYVAVGSSFDAISALSSIFKSIGQSALIVDAYMDESMLTEFSPLIPEGVEIALLTDEGGVRPGLEPAARAWVKQYGNARPLSLRVTAKRVLHDRLILGGDGSAWLLTQSFKDFAKRSPAAIQKLDPELADAKFHAYGEIWNAAAPKALD
jgi:hypothetical protein